MRLCEPRLSKDSTPVKGLTCNNDAKRRTIPNILLKSLFSKNGLDIAIHEFGMGLGVFPIFFIHLNLVL